MIRDQSGITLIELVVVVSIIAILIFFVTLSFEGYQAKYNIESQIKTLYSDIMGARMKAMNENRLYVVKFTSPNSYVVAIDNDWNGDFNAGDTKVDKYSKSGLNYNLAWGFQGSTNRIILDNRGLVNVNGNIRVDRTNDAEYDCIVISNTRIKMGKWDGTKCDPR